jgi:O-antigen ligase
VAPGLLNDAAELPKLVALALSTTLLASAGIGRLALLRAPCHGEWPLKAPLAALGAVALLSMANTAAPVWSLYALLFLVSMLVAAFTASLLPSPARVANAMMASAGVVALYGLGQYVGFEFLPWAPHFKPRIFSTTGNPVFLGGFISAVFPLVLARWFEAEREETKDLLTLLLAALGLAAFLTWTRTSWAAIAAGSAVQVAMLASTPRGRGVISRNKGWLAAAVLLAIVAVAVINSTRMLGTPGVPVADRLKDAFNPGGYSFRFRMVTSESALRIARMHPVLGAGIGSYPVHYPGVRLLTRAARTEKTYNYASQEAYAHNDHLQVLAELGIVGLGAWIWLIVCALRLARARERAGDWLGLGVAGMVTAFAVEGAGNFPLHIAPNTWVFFAALGLLGAGTATAPEPASTRSRRNLAWALVAVCALAAIRPCWNRLMADRFLKEGDTQVSYNNYEMAEAYYGEGVLRDPGNKFLNFRYSVALFKVARYDWRGQYLDRALDHARRALALGYEDENVYKHIADMQEAKGAIRKTIAPLDTAYALQPNWLDVSNNLSYMLAQSGTRLDEAVALAEKAVRGSPNNSGYMDTLGWAYFCSGQAARAEEWVVKSLRLLPNDQRLLGARAEITAHLEAIRKARRGGRR